MKQAIVTGSTGFIGSVLVRALVGSGINVVALGRKEHHELSLVRQKKITGSSYLNVAMEEIERLDREMADRKLEVGDDCVFFNLAWGGRHGLSDQDLQKQLENVSHAVNALEVAEDLGCSRFVQVGTMEEAFAEAYLTLDFRQENKANRHLYYALAKIAAKKALLLKSKKLDIELIYVKNSHVMGPDDDKDSFLQVTLMKLISGAPLEFSSGEQVFDVISVEDCAQAYIDIAQSGLAGSEYWIGSGSPRHLKEYVLELAELFPSDQVLQFGAFPFNDVILDPGLFSIENLARDTGFVPQWTFQEIALNLRDTLV